MFKRLQMLHHCRQRHGEGLGQLADRSRPATEPVDHGAARGIGQCLEHEVEIGLLVKHDIK
ncbi:hypothetical protein D3C72_1858810 [compost metagenome]